MARAMTFLHFCVKSKLLDSLQELQGVQVDTCLFPMRFYLVLSFKFQQRILPPISWWALPIRRLA